MTNFDLHVQTLGILKKKVTYTACVVNVPFYGHIMLLQLSAVWRDSQPVGKKEAQFKLTDRTAHLFAKGTSNAVL